MLETTALESNLRPQLYRTAAAGSVDPCAAADGSGNVAIGRAGDRRLGIAELRRVRKVEAFRSQFNIEALADLNILEQRRIQNKQSRTTEGVAPRCTERHASRLREARGAEPRIANVDALRIRHWRDLVGRLRFARRVQTAAAGSDGANGRTGHNVEDAGELPAADYIFRGSMKLSPPRTPRQ